MNKEPNKETIKAIEEARSGEGLETIDNLDKWLDSVETGREKLPRWIRLIRYGFNCMWYHVLFPLGTKEDGFIKSK